MKRIVMAATLGAALLIAGAPAAADWDDGDPVKMHFPQHPDPNGWDVTGGSSQLCDDFQCIQTGYIKDVHLWGSWKGDREASIVQITLFLYGNLEPNTAANPYLWSMPGDLIDSITIPSTDWTIRPWPGGDQGWYYPGDGLNNEPNIIRYDHQMTHQINIKIDDPNWYQVKDEIYWLGVWVVPEDASDPNMQAYWGWKTSLEHFMDDAVYYGVIPGTSLWTWLPLEDPYTGQTLDLAFVITPEPITAALLVGGGGALLFRKRRRR
ncbi:MAG TPA: PEP-CTERM sorting domain-containing protein [Phycisphaerae bacterium]|nr:PEP-CTERM sorting domain-containing protein [Phycisphaerae bacterium]